MGMVIGFVLAMLLVGGVLFLSAFLEGIVVVQFWHWFVLPLWPHAPALTIPYAVGLATLVTVVTWHYQEGVDKQYKPKHTAWEYLGLSITRPLMALLIGWIIHQFV